MTTARAYRGKYPNRIRSVSYGTSKVWFLESNDGQRVNVTAAQARTICGTRGPQLGDDIGPYVAIPATLDAIHTGTSNNVTACRAARDMVRTADDTQPSQQAFPLYGYIARGRVIGMVAVAHQMAQAGRPVHEALIVARYVGK